MLDISAGPGYWILDIRVRILIIPTRLLSFNSGDISYSKTYRVGSFKIKNIQRSFKKRQQVVFIERRQMPQNSWWTARWTPSLWPLVRHPPLSGTSSFSVNLWSVESLQSHMILTMSHRSSGLTCLLPATRVTGSNPLGGLCETGILLLALSRYIGDPDVIDHQQDFAPPNCH